MNSGNFQTNPAHKAKLLIDALSANNPIPDFGQHHCYKPEYAMNEASEDFSHRSIAAGKYICNGKEVFFINEPLLTTEQKKLVSPVCKKTKIPLVLSIELDPNPIRGNVHPMILENEFNGTEDLQRAYSYS